MEQQGHGWLECSRRGRDLPGLISPAAAATRWRDPRVLNYLEGDAMNLFPLLLAQNDDAAAAAGGLVSMCCSCIFPLAIFALIVAGLWKIFEKAGRPGWAAIIPFYNMYVVTEIAGRDIIWFILLLVPCVNIVAAVLIWMDLAKNFGKDPIWGLGLAFLGPIFIPLLGFSDARHQPVPKQMM
jgi:hypothetical protein